MDTIPTPITRRRSAGSLTRRVAALAVATVAVVALVASADDNEATMVDNDGAEQGQAGAQEGAAPQAFSVGDTVALGDWQVTVNSVVDPWVSPNEFDNATGRFVEVDVTVVNNSDSPAAVSSLLCFELRDASGRSADTAFVAGGRSSPDGEVDPGGVLSGNLYYDVETDASGLTMRFKCDLLSSGSATINL